MILTFLKLKKVTKKIVYGTGVATLLTLVIIVVFKLFVFSVPPNDTDVAGLGNDDYYSQMKKNYIIYSPYIPEDLDFCGEKVPADRFDVHKALDYEFLKIMYWHSEAILIIKRKQAAFAVVQPILKKYNIPDDFKYLMVTESSITNVVSPANAEGYWQFLKNTAKQYGLEVNSEVDERYDLEKSTEAACKYLLDSYRQLKSWTLVAASYNVGLAGIQTQIDRQKQSNFYDLLLNRETARYIYRIVAFKAILQNPRKYGFYIRPVDMYQEPEFDIIQVNSSIPSLIDFAIEYGTSYRLVRIMNPWLRSDKLTNSSGKTYYIKIPKRDN